MAKKRKKYESASRKRQGNTKAYAFRPQVMQDDGKPVLGGLGDVWGNEGSVLGHSTKGGMTIRYEIASCSCAGENSSCFKCDGTGYYRREVVEAVSNSKNQMANTLRVASRNGVSSENGFSNDSRGGDSGVREKGRFSSNPLHDDYDN